MGFNRENQMQKIIQELNSETSIYPTKKHCASIAKAIDEEITADEFVGLIEMPNDPVVNHISSHVGVRINGVIYDGSGRYSSEEEFVKSNILNKKLDTENPMNHFWSDNKLPDVPTKPDMNMVRDVVRGAIKN